MIDLQINYHVLPIFSVFEFLQWHYCVYDIKNVHNVSLFFITILCFYSIL